jgi:3D (Asp-Asp-Asp) domain-containing protein
VFGLDSPAIERGLQVGVAAAVAALAAAVLTGAAAYRLTSANPLVEGAASGAARTADGHVHLDEPARAVTTVRSDVALTGSEDAPRVPSDASVHERALPLSVAPPGASIIAPPTAPVVEAAAGDRLFVTLSFYYCEHLDSGVSGGDGGAFCGLTRDGSQVAPGVAACDAAYLGQRFRIEGDPYDLLYRCADTGSAVGGQHRDIWFHTAAEGWDWIARVGHQGVIEVAR